MSSTYKFSFIGLLLAGLACHTCAFDLGHSDATIFSSSRDLKVALELRDYLAPIFSRQYSVEVYTPAASQSAGIFVGVVPADFPMSEEERPGKEFCAMQVQGNQLYLFGSQKFPSCTAYAVYDFLEKHCGVRWLWPGDTGTVIEPLAPFSLANGLTITRPGMDLRLTSSFHYGSTSRSRTSNLESGAWQRRAKVGASYDLRVGHAFDGLVPHNAYAQDHPEYYSLVTPKNWVGLVKPKEATRTWDKTLQTCSQLCTSNPEVRKIVAEQVAKRAAETGRMQSISPNDGYGFCECDECKKQDAGQVMFSGGNYLTNRMYDFLKDVASQVKQLNPDAKVGMFSYSWFSGVPENIDSLPDNVYLSLCYSTEDHFKPATEKADNDRILGLGRLGAKIIGREYWGTHHTLDLPLLNSRKIAANVKLLHSVKAGGIYGETGSAFAARASDLYILTRMAWDPTLERDDLLQDFCDKGFGNASQTMLNYFNTIEDRVFQINQQAAEREPSEIQKQYSNGYAARHTVYLEIFTPEFLAETKAMLQQAKKQAKTAEQKARVDFIIHGHVFAEIMTECVRNRQRLAAAGVDMSLVQPSAELVRMERDNLRQVARAVIASEDKRGKYLLSLADRPAIGIGQFIYASSLHLRPWRSLAEAAGIELAANKFSYLVNGSFEYRGYSWEVKTTQGEAEHEYIAGINCDERNNYMVTSHANQGISLQAKLGPKAEMTITSLRPAVTEQERKLKLSLWMRNQDDPLQYLEAKINQATLKPSWLNREIVGPDEWNQVACQQITVQPGEHTLQLKLRNPSEQQVTINLDNIRMVLE